MLTIRNRDKIRDKELPYRKEWHVEGMKEIIIYAPNTKRMTHYYDIQIVNSIQNQRENILLNREMGDNSKGIRNCYELHCVKGGARHVKLLTINEIKKMGNLLNWIKLLGVEYK